MFLLQEERLIVFLPLSLLHLRTLVERTRKAVMTWTDRGGSVRSSKQDVTAIDKGRGRKCEAGRAFCGPGLSSPPPILFYIHPVENYRCVISSWNECVPFKTDYMRVTTRQRAKSTSAAPRVMPFNLNVQARPFDLE